MKRPPRTIHLPRDAQRLAAETCHRLLPVAERQAREGKPSLLNAILDFLRPREETVHIDLRHGGTPPRLQ